MVFLFLPSGGGKLKDQIMVQKTRLWSFKIRMRMDVMPRRRPALDYILPSAYSLKDYFVVY